MDGEAITDLILRAVAAMRERGELPEFENPRFIITRLAGDALVYCSNAGAAIAAAQPDDQRGASGFARAIAAYLTEVVDLVPAYHEVRSITPSDDGTITVVINAPRTTISKN